MIHVHAVDGDVFVLCGAAARFAQVNAVAPHVAHGNAFDDDVVRACYTYAHAPFAAAAEMFATVANQRAAEDVRVADFVDFKDFVIAGGIGLYFQHAAVIHAHDHVAL